MIAKRERNGLQESKGQLKEKKMNLIMDDDTRTGFTQLQLFG